MGAPVRAPASWKMRHQYREVLKFIVGIYLNRYLDTRVSLNRLD